MDRKWTGILCNTNQCKGLGLVYKNRAMLHYL